jgi:peptide subunit release factor 1 (eRF1)
MTTKLRVHEATIRPSLVAELEAFRAPGQRVSSYYLALGGSPGGDAEAAKLAIKNALATQRVRLDRLELQPAVRQALQHEWELVQELALLTAGRRDTRALACFVASAGGYGRALPLPWPVRDRAFFEDRFVLWPLHQVLDQADRFAVCLTDKDDARLFLVHLERIEEVASFRDEIPGRVRFPDPIKQWHYANKHVESFHRHFEHVAEETLRLLQREPFEHLIVGGLWEHLPEFEGHLHRYLRDRIVARWDIDVHTPAPQVLERALQEEQNVLKQQAKGIWKSIQDNRARRGALGPEETFAALWQRRVQALLIEPGVSYAGFRCRSCGRLHFSGGPCVECGGKMAEIADVYDEALHDAIEQSAQVRFWKDPALDEADSIAALKRF